MSNIMDNMTAKEREEEMGFSESQKSALEAAGLTRKEIAELHAQRVAENIAKERERLDKLEKRIAKGNGGKSFAAAFADMLEGKSPASETPVETDPNLTAQFMTLIKGGKGLSSPSSDSEADNGRPWEGRNDLIMSNADYWAEMYKKGVADLPDPDEAAKMSDEDLDKALAAFYASLNAPDKEELFERRRLGYYKAYEEWQKSGGKGEPPEGIDEIIRFSLPN